jgi:hypothetical protein
MSSNEIKLEIFRQVDALDANKLKEFYGVMQNYINSKRDADEWIGVNSVEKQGIEAAIQELNAGAGIPHDQVINELRQKHTHA